MKKVNALAILVALTLVACSNKISAPPGEIPRQDGVTIGNGAYLKMSADLTNAESLTSNVVLDKSKEKKQLFKLTPGKKLAVVLEGEHELISYKLTPTHIIARVNIVEKNQKNEYDTCSLIAIPKVKGKSKVLCLNRDLMGCQHFEPRAGYDTRGSEVFFTHQKEQTRSPSSPHRSCYAYSVTGESGAAASELRRWDGKSEIVETLFHTDPQVTKDAQLFISDVFASSTNENLCIDTANDGQESLFCRQGVSKRWEKVRGFHNGGAWAVYVKQGNQLLSDRYIPFLNDGGKLNLETLEITKRKGDLPLTVEFTLDNGGFLGRNGNGDEIRLIDPDGNAKSLFRTDLKATPARIGGHAWYAGTKTLQRVALHDGQLDERDYFANTDLLRASSISWALNDFLQVEGLTAMGQPGTSYLNGDGAFVLFEGRSVPLEHPITLQWDR